MSVNISPAGLFALVTVNLRTALAFSLLVEDTTAWVSDVVPVTLDIVAKALVDLGEGFGSVVQTRSIKTLETHKLKLKVEIVSWSDFFLIGRPMCHPCLLIA